MKKLTLDLENLRVESFETSDARGSRKGTVRGHSFEEEFEQMIGLTTTNDRTFNGSCYCNTQSCPTQGASCRTCVWPVCTPI